MISALDCTRLMSLGRVNRATYSWSTVPRSCRKTAGSSVSFGIDAKSAICDEIRSGSVTGAQSTCARAGRARRSAAIALANRILVSAVAPPRAASLGSLPPLPIHDQALHPLDQVGEIERLRDQRAPARADQILRELARVAAREYGVRPELRLQGGRELEEHVAAHVGHAQVDDQAIEMLRAQERERD